MITDSTITKSGRYVALGGIVAAWVSVVLGIVHAISVQCMTGAPVSTSLYPALALLVVGCVIHALLVAAWCVIGKSWHGETSHPNDEKG